MQQSKVEQALRDMEYSLLVLRKFLLSEGQHEQEPPVPIPRTKPQHNIAKRHFRQASKYEAHPFVCLSDRCKDTQTRWAGARCRGLSKVGI